MKTKGIVLCLISFLLFPSLLSSCYGGYGVWVNIKPDVMVKNSAGQNIEPWKDEFYLDYFIDQDVADQSKIRSIMNDVIARMYPLFDAENNYDVDLDDPSLGVISNVKVLQESGKSGERKVLDPHLYKLLKQGYEYSRNDPNFSIFSGNLQRFWNEQFERMEENKTNLSLDPALDTQKKLELEQIVACIPSNPETVIEFFEETKEVQFTIEEACLGENIQPKIDVDQLSTVYVGQMIKEELIKQGYNKGILIMKNVAIALGDPVTSAWSMSLRDPRYQIDPDDAHTVASLNLKKAFTVVTVDDFPLHKNYYFIDETEQKVLYRHPLISALTGYPINEVRSLHAISSTLTAVDLYLEAFKLYQTPRNEITSNRSNEVEVLYTFQEGIDDTSICSSSSWCPTTPSTLYLKSTSDFEGRFYPKENVQFELLS